MAHILSLKQSAVHQSGYFLCNLCWEKGSGPCYHCEKCDFDIHVSCAAIAKQQSHFTHFQHPLHLKHVTDVHVCNGCGDDIHTWVFRCSLCDYDMHSLCARAPRYIVHPGHEHALVLFDSKNLKGSCACDGCGKIATAQVYRCCICNFDMHPSCASMPFHIKYSKHPEHRLKLLFRPPDGRTSFTCSECTRQGDKWLYHCDRCSYSLHPRCANVPHELPHSVMQSSIQESRNMTATSVTQRVMPTPNVDNTDLEAVERVLQFLRQVVLDPSACSSVEKEKEQDICPTCLEGYDSHNPKKSTSCGHHFHLSCILAWMERSNRCPICRKDVGHLL